MEKLFGHLDICTVYLKRGSFRHTKNIGQKNTVILKINIIKLHEMELMQLGERVNYLYTQTC
jgi:hypothetical protein